MASSCQRWSTPDSLAILSGLIQRDEDVTDPQIPMLLWWALERQMRRDQSSVVNLLTTTEIRGSLMARDHLLERTARALAEGGRDDDWQDAARLLAGSDDSTRAKLIAGLDKGLEGRRLDGVPGPMEGPVDALLDGSSGIGAIRLAARLGSPKAEEAAIRGARDSKAPDSDRIALFELLGALRSDRALGSLLEILSAGPPEGLQLPVLNAIGSYADSTAADALLTSLPKLSGASRARAIDLMCGRKDWARKLVDSLGPDGAVKPTELRPTQVIQLSKLGDERLVADLEAKWGRVPKPSSAEKVKRIAEVRGMLPEGDKGDPKRGVLVFREQCSACHKLFGEGEAIGPELTGADRSLDFLLESLVNPSAVIRKEYQPITVAMEDGRVISGLIVEETDGAVTLFDSQKQKTVLPKSSIDEMKASETSVMPEGLLDTLKEEQVRDLFRYLQSAGPPG